MRLREHQNSLYMLSKLLQNKVNFSLVTNNGRKTKCVKLYYFSNSYLSVSFYLWPTHTVYHVYFEVVFKNKSKCIKICGIGIR